MKNTTKELKNLDNENKDFQGNEVENTLSPEEKVREDIRSKIADAAAELEDEASEIVEEAEIAGDETAEYFEEVAEEAFEEGAEFAPAYEEFEAVKPEPVRVTVKRSSFILSLIASAVIGALVLLLGMQIPGWVSALPEGNTVAKVNGEKITDLDVNYYIYSQVASYASDNNLSLEDMYNFDWSAPSADGDKTIGDIMKENAVKDAVNEAIIIELGRANGIVLDEAAENEIKSTLEGISSAYGKDGFALRVRTMGIASPKQYEKMYRKVMLASKVNEDMTANPGNYYPEDTSVLNEYIQPDVASVKHILISTQVTEGEDVNPEDKRAIAEAVLERAKGGEDFDALVEEFNEDPGMTDAGYTFGPGEMMPEFEEASFALGMNEISDIVETSYGYHIIKRIPGVNELLAYYKAGNGDIKIKVNVNERKINKLDIAAIFADIKTATDELTAQETSSASAQPSSVSAAE